MLNITHHGGAKGVTGSCHQLTLDSEHSLLIDCGYSKAKTPQKTPSISYKSNSISAPSKRWSSPTYISIT